MNKDDLDKKLDNNRLILEFMGYTKDVYNHGKNGFRNIWKNDSINKGHYRTLLECRFDCYWDELMPVIEKIESISELSQNRKCNFHVTIEKHRCFIKWGIGCTICDVYDYHNNKISVVYRAVIEFIKWYNQNKLNEAN